MTNKILSADGTLFAVEINSYCPDSLLWEVRYTDRGQQKTGWEIYTFVESIDVPGSRDTGEYRLVFENGDEPTEPEAYASVADALNNSSL